MVKEKIFVSAYACEPNKGSEIGVGWHWILEMSRQYDLWVLTRESNKLNIENWLSNHQVYGNITFVYYDLPKFLRWWKKGLRGVRTYYWLWQKFTNKIVKRVMTGENIKIYHLLTYGNALWPASKYGMKQFFIWGPVGGTDTVPVEYTKHYDVKSRLIEWTRSMVVKMLPLNVGFRKRCRNANIILCKTEYMRENILKKYRDKAVVFTDVAVEEKASILTHKEDNEIIKYLAVGRLDAWRGFDLLIEAFNKAKEVEKNIQLQIVGEGIYRKKLQKLIDKYELSDKVFLLGQLSEKEYNHELTGADVVVNPTLKEGNVTVAFDSMQAGKPLICVDTKGYTKNMGENAIILEIGKREKLVDHLSEAILKMVDSDLRKDMSEGAKELAAKHTWEEKGKAINQLIREAYGR